MLCQNIEQIPLNMLGKNLKSAWVGPPNDKVQGGSLCGNVLAGNVLDYLVTDLRVKKVAPLTAQIRDSRGSAKLLIVDVTVQAYHWVGKHQLEALFRIL